VAILTLIDGKKGPSDVLILVASYNEPFSLAEWLYLGKHFLDSEASYYPVEQGFSGRAYLLCALTELSHGVDFQRILRKYRLQDSHLRVIDKRKKSASTRPIEKLHEVLE
jgi:alkylation response protein AidB-like acyl-CoA dehydrogenase